jgi:hypothetical protein
MHPLPSAPGPAAAPHAARSLSIALTATTCSHSAHCLDVCTRLLLLPFARPRTHGLRLRFPPDVFAILAHTMLSRRSLKMAVREIARTDVLTACRRGSKDMAVARLAYDDAYDAGPGDSALDEESDGGRSDPCSEIRCVFTPFSAYMQCANSRTATSRPQPALPALSSASRPHPRRTCVRTRSPTLRLLHLPQHDHHFRLRITFASAAPPKSHFQTTHAT